MGMKRETNKHLFMFSNIKAENVCENLKKKFADAEKSE
jgi:hypothetical protein